MNYKETFIFIARLLSLDSEKQAKLYNDFSGKVDWGILVQVASSQLVFPTLYLRFKQPYFIDLLPKDLLSYMEYIYKLNLERNLKIISQAKKLNNLLTENQIYPVFLKGVACLLDNIYQDLGERMIGDIDLLVEEKDFLNAVQILQSSGYEQMGSFRKEQVPLIKHYPRLIKTDEIAAVEIHRQPVNIPYTHFFNSELVFSEKKISFSQRNLFVPSDAHKAIHNFIHSQLANSAHYYGNILLRNCYDFYLIQKRQTNKTLNIHPHYQTRFNIYRNITSEFIEGTYIPTSYYQIYRSRLWFNLNFRIWQLVNNIVLFLFQKIYYYFQTVFNSFFNWQVRNHLKEVLKEPGRLKKHVQFLLNELKHIANPKHNNPG